MVATVSCVEGSVATNAKLALPVRSTYLEINPNLDLFEGELVKSA